MSVKTFQSVHGKFDGRLEKGINCLICGRTSWNQNDVREKYCGNCHQYHDVMSAGLVKVGEFIEKGRGPR